MNDGQRNNFDALRLIGAFLVLISHQFALSGRLEPNVVGDHSFGNLGVLIFFSISGYLVTASWLKDPHILRFTARRALRMAPALCVSIPLSLAVIAALGLTGFPQNPRHLTNGSLWTIPYEVYCYGLLLVAGVATRRPSIVLAVGILGYFVVSGLQSGGAFLAYFGLFFAAGSLLRAYPYLRTTLPTLVFFVTGFALIHMGQTKFGLAFVVPSLTIAIGVRSWPGLRDISKIGDLSYGIYIYAWPVQQIGVALLGRQTPYLALLAVTVPVTVALAAVSWHLVEKNALRFKPRQRWEARSAANPQTNLRVE
ncbi:acyltransferase [Luteibacter pinisoli]|uniref:Acyltransferase n=1 Tax=Luteibacter pinisoli TaxID=2589080 RepID=A0A4Y5Z1J7_9GAMM|nr:acyltransferase [Luteibacter pinisoli]QDE39091.1 acyltransferase [Luteibacter pinisoli]